MKWILPILTVLLITPAAAQNVTCADRPLADSSNACANTRFVQSKVVAPGGNNGDIQYNNAGAFGGIPQVTVPKGGTGVATFTANEPILGNGTSPLIQGTRSGNTTVFGTVSGALTPGNYVKSDASGNLIDGGTISFVNTVYAPGFGAL